jgi:hypothetical protein
MLPAGFHFHLRDSMLFFCKTQSKRLPVPIVKSIETIIHKQKIVFICVKIGHPVKVRPIKYPMRCVNSVFFKVQERLCFHNFKINMTWN